MSGQSFSPSLGARTLKTKETSLSLPTYPKLLEQIEEIRQNAMSYQCGQDSQNAFLRPQVINNFSVLGPRGSGKSSILKTLYHDLGKEEGKNILLPPVVPENLESHMTLMSSLLGLLGDQVEQLANAAKEQKPSCPICPPTKTSLKNEYRKLVENYVHLQKPYQDISIQKYSTESDYVRTMSDVFEAGNQFSWRLWDFIDLLLDQHEPAKDALLFVFIDDIDLSTYRCSDVVRTLLGYISHPRVVTVLAGDIEVFGEALTLDFLRQEELLGKDGIAENYTVSQAPSREKKDLLCRKKELAYEYLKKVMPPVNRHSISIWTLSNRGRFCPAGLYSSESGDIPSLQALLAKTNQFKTLPSRSSSESPESLLEGYFSPPEDQEASDKVLYHLFDSTARGLINCYIPIEQLVRQWDDKDSRFRNIKFTLEAIVYSNSELNDLRDQIFPSFLQFGTACDSSSVLFDNFNDWTDQQLPYMAGVPQKEGEMEKNRDPATSAVPLPLKTEIRIFRIFVFLDWAARLLGKENALNSEDYDIAKRRALFLLCANGSISEKNEELPEADRSRLYQLGISNLKSSTYSGSAAEISLRCFFGLPFPLAVRYFHSFDLPQMLVILSDLNNTKHLETALDKLQRAVDFIQVLNRFYQRDSLRASTCLANQSEMLAFIGDQLGEDQNAMLVNVICSAYFKGERLAPLYRQYCRNGIALFVSHVTADAFHPISVSYYPPSVSRMIQASPNWENDLNSYLSGSPKFSYSEKSLKLLESFISSLNVTSIDDELNPYPAYSGESQCAFYWNDLLKENGDLSNAAPIYNFYSRQIWKAISAGNHHLRPLADLYADSATLEKKLCEGKPDRAQHIEKRLKVLFAIDSGNLWTLGTQDGENESPIRQIKSYILKQLTHSEESLLRALDFQQEVRKDEAPNAPRYPLVAASGASDAFEHLKNAYTGSSITLAKRCIQFLRPLFEEKYPDHMTVADFIYARRILCRLIYSNAWYGKSEARALLSVLDQASLNLPLDNGGAGLDRYVFWFHCYCRYRVAELSDDTYTLIEQAYGGMKLIRDAESVLDQRDKNFYHATMRSQGQLEDDLIQQIPDLFSQRG